MGKNDEQIAMDLAAAVLTRIGRTVQAMRSEMASPGDMPTGCESRYWEGGLRKGDKRGPRRSTLEPDHRPDGLAAQPVYGVALKTRAAGTGTRQYSANKARSLRADRARPRHLPRRCYGALLAVKQCFREPGCGCGALSRRLYPANGRGKGCRDTEERRPPTAHGARFLAAPCAAKSAIPVLLSAIEYSR